MDLNKAQLKYLRKLSHKEKPLFQLGKLGLTDVFIEQIDSALTKRELIKFVILQNSDEDLVEATEIIAERTNATIVQTIGNTAILYRPSAKEKYQEISQEVMALA
ncbi:ribosome assembly RNA-binding protein YhbY [Fundicoccus culcitae]|uniref:Ribosome assembly RNA-binding protein YhbY n=1 Tax=Fundicoccus culcitae TaxID=2969821 RepID=A0ABY5P717_9LACT|nr:ribosome assembly RNA-binding protein YhbY [Fundicoccus culcitae]UUX34198.1 ribosome assembly RNA-binding protein YhbY [Fundicoccus culcitae]